MAEEINEQFRRSTDRLMGEFIGELKGLRTDLSEIKADIKIFHDDRNELKVLRRDIDELKVTTKMLESINNQQEGVKKFILFLTTLLGVIIGYFAAKH